MPQPMTLPLLLEEPEVVKATCDVHSWMGSYIVVKDNPYFAVTGYKDAKEKLISSDEYAAGNDKGVFTIKDVPAGTYTIQAWHEVLGNPKPMEKKVTVPATGEVKVNFEFSPKKKK